VFGQSRSDPDTDRPLHVRLYSTRTAADISTVLSELRETHRVGGVSSFAGFVTGPATVGERPQRSI